MLQRPVESASGSGLSLAEARLSGSARSSHPIRAPSKEAAVTDIAHLRQHYERLETEELLCLQPQNLTEDAWQILQSEIEKRRMDPWEAKHFGAIGHDRFKTDMSQLGRKTPPPGQPFAWLKWKPSHDQHMGQRQGSVIPNDLRKLQESCTGLKLLLPSSFLLLMESPQLWTRFRSMNDGFFEVKKPPIRCPVSNGYLIPFISDQQYCHFYFLHLAPGRTEHEVVWADDHYHGALYADEKVFESDYRSQFDPTDIQLCNQDFERFMYCHLEDHEKFFESSQFLAGD